MLFRSTPDDGWHAEVCTDDGGPIEAALRRGMRSSRSNAGVLERTSVAVSERSGAHSRLAAWERAHLASLATRLRREHGDGSDHPWTDIAVALTALIEGMHLMWAQFAEVPGEVMPTDLAEEVIDTAVRVIDFMVQEVEGCDMPLAEPSDEPGQGQVGTVLPKRLADALADGTLDDGTGSTRRIVDMGILSRTRGVSERSLYKRWPTAAELNAELYLTSVERTQAAFMRIILEVFQTTTLNPSGDMMPLIARMNEWFMTPSRFPEARVHLSLADVLLNQDALDLLRDSVELGLQHADLQTSGMIHATGFNLRPDVRMRTYTMLIVGMGMGSHRTSALHPQLLDRRLRYLGSEYLAAGLGHTAMTRTCTVPVEPSLEAGAPATG